ncbi:hypothetical protein PGT21_018026 [Puccinia graminis f. sp. tritici]|uniref:Uncharacterized protein n=1 Tax=Puccinia graminis f. sp. tritici TaxID=56615 RepID=A0A5B0RC29_PUCGR|nr:hypothetical protein PGT21_018026 [Puccinia graminis f. sp. tritici]KAA1122623.1 hypothetical protein PGTUg99_001879 [Puccinia graminis f. sp. tritici]
MLLRFLSQTAGIFESEPGASLYPQTPLPVPFCPKIDLSLFNDQSIDGLIENHQGSGFNINNNEVNGELPSLEDLLPTSSENTTSANPVSPTLLMAHGNFTPLDLATRGRFVNLPGLD